MMTEPFNLPWPKREFWTVSEAACLLRGIEPIRGRDDFESALPIDPSLDLLYRELKDATLKGSIPFTDTGGWYGNRRIDPRACIAWAVAKELCIPERLQEM